MNKSTVTYPYLPPGQTLLYVSLENEFMQAAKAFGENNSLDKAVPTGSVIVAADKIIGRGANGSTYHQTQVCERVRRNIPTGQGYELCEGCHPKNHSEAKAIADALAHGHETQGANLYLWGHWWCCESCWKSMLQAGIKKVYVLEQSYVLFNKADPNNILPNEL